MRSRSHFQPGHHDQTAVRLMQITPPSRGETMFVLYIQLALILTPLALSRLARWFGRSNL